MSSQRGCAKCAEIKPVADFSLMHGKPHAWCRPCLRTYNREYKRAHPTSPEATRRAIANTAAKKRAASAARRELLAPIREEARRARKRAGKAARRAGIAKACPRWVDRKAITRIYAEAAQRSAEGAPHEVDHIVPLNHPEVCGLHVPWNLQVIPETDNRRKSNRLLAA